MIMYTRVSSVTDTNIHIVNSYQIESKVVMEHILMDIQEDYPDIRVFKERSMKSLINEWVGHNNLFKLHLFRSHTTSVDLQVPVKWYEPIAWWLLSRVIL